MLSSVKQKIRTTFITYLYGFSLIGESWLASYDSNKRLKLTIHKIEQTVTKKERKKDFNNYCKKKKKNE